MTRDELTPADRGVFTVWTVGGAQVVLILRVGGIMAVRHPGAGAAMPGDGVVREVADVTAWPRVGERMVLRFADGEALTTTEVRRIARVSTADLHQQGRGEYARQVIERAAKLAAEEEAP